MANHLTGMLFLRFQKVDDTKTNFVRGQIGPAVGHDVDRELGPYLCHFPRSDGQPSHSALVHAAHFAGPDFVLFQTPQQLQDFLLARLPALSAEGAHTESPVAKALPPC